MKLAGEAAIAMWWNVAEEHLPEFHEWHSKEHFPERLAIPGFNRGSRWQREGSGEFFVLYELAAYETLTSVAYRARLDAPTSWSTKMMPLHRGMIRSQCRVASSNGGGIAAFMATVRLSPRSGAETALDRFLGAAIADLPQKTGVSGAHLLKTETPASAPTTEQKIRGGDAVADWIVLIAGFNGAALREACATMLDAQTLRDNGAGEAEYGEPFRLVHAVTKQDL